MTLEFYHNSEVMNEQQGCWPIRCEEPLAPSTLISTKGISKDSQHEREILLKSAIIPDKSMSKETNHRARTHAPAATPLPDDIAALLDRTRQATPKELAKLKRAAKVLNEDSAFIADVAKGLIVEDILRAMEASGLNRNTLAAKIGKSRQYVGKILDDHRRANFTIDTLAELATALGLTLHTRMLPAVETQTASVAKKATKKHSSQTILQ